MYRTVDLDIWKDERFLALSAPPPSAQTLWLYLLVGRHTTFMPGVILASSYEICAALRWPYAVSEPIPDRYPEPFRNGSQDGRSAFAEILAAGMARVDDDVGLIFLPNAIKRNPPHNPNHVKSWRKVWDQVPGCALKAEIHETYRGFLEASSKPMLKAFRDAIPEPIPQQIPNTGKQVNRDLPLATLGGAGPVQAGLALPSPDKQRDQSPAKPAKSAPRGNGAERPEKRRGAQASAPGGVVAGGDGTELTLEPLPSAPRPEFTQFVATFDALFRAHRGGAKPAWGEKQGAQVKRLLKAHGLAECESRARRMFEMAPRWPAENPDLMTLAGHWDKFAPPPEAKRDVRFGYAEPAPHSAFVSGKVEI